MIKSLLLFIPNMIRAGFEVFGEFVLGTGTAHYSANRWYLNRGFIVVFALGLIFGSLITYLIV